MIKIRKGTFETNSSSTHAICIPKEKFADNYLPNSLRYDKKENVIICFHLDYFGWDWKTLYDQDALNYLYTFMFCYLGDADFKDGIDKIKACLKKRDIKCSFEKSKIKDRDYFIWDTTKKQIGIDQSSSLHIWYNDLIKDDAKLWSFICKGQVFTGNDNSDIRMPDFTDKCWAENYEIFEKGN